MLINLCKLQILYNFLLFDPQYKGLHVKSKTMYTLIIDTMMYRMNKGIIEIDKNGHQYIEFENEYFKKLLNISVNAVNKFKKELIKVGLIDVLQKQENNVFTSTCQKSKTKNLLL
ncbi:replication initiator protein A [Staphylococcus warneri]|uniref:replication initiator protein A n=1 Tax=Staphylococcus warneri TaxID=1292 RepID=UPI000E1C107D|nr:replication initiator protein A [Staphylococcus warneri]